MQKNILNNYNDYKFLVKKIVCNKLRKVYVKKKSKSKKQFLKYKGKMIDITTFKKLKKMKKGGSIDYDYYYNQQINYKFIPFLNKLNTIDKNDLNSLINCYKMFYNNNLDFLINILIFIEINYKNLSNYIDKFRKLKILLHLLDAEAITGIYFYTEKKNPNNEYGVTDRKYFDTIKKVIENLKTKHNKFSENIFYNNGTINIPYHNLVISNTHVRRFISIVISENGLNNYDQTKTKKYLNTVKTISFKSKVKKKI